MILNAAGPCREGAAPLCKGQGLTTSEQQGTRAGILSGMLWSVLSAGAGVILPLGIFVTFARLLDPAQIGLVALVVACTEILKPFGRPGLHEALLQHPADRTDLHETAAALMLWSGLALLPIHVLAVLALSHMVAGVADLIVPLSLVGLRIVFDFAATQPQVRLAQRLAYRRLALRGIAANLAAGATGIGCAVMGAPLAGLIAYQVGQSGFGLCFLLFAEGAAARPVLHRGLRALLAEGWPASAVRLVSATQNSMDQIVLAPLVGALPLAYYNLGKRVEGVFITASSSVSQVLLQPLYAAIRPDERSHAMRRSLALLILLCGLPACVVAANAELAVTTVFGPQWVAASPVAGLLALSGLARALGGVHGALLSVSGRNRQLLAVAAVSAGLGVAIMIPVGFVGLVWCTAALTAKNAIFAATEAWMTRRDLPGLARAYAAEVLTPLLLMLVAAVGGRLLAEAYLPQAGLVPAILRLGLSGLVAAVAVGAYLGLRHRDALSIHLRRKRMAA